MKRLLSVFLILAMLLTLAACGASAPAATEASAETEMPAQPETEPETQPESEDPNLIPGGSFDAPEPMWALYSESGGDGAFAVAEGELKVSIRNAGRVAHAVQIYCDGFEILKGAEYQLSFRVRSTVERTMEWRIQLNGGDYHAYAGEQAVAVGPEERMVSLTFVMEEDSDPAPRFCFNLGDADRAQGLEAHELYFDDVELLLLDDSHAEAVASGSGAVDINVNQLGYRPQDAKEAVLRNMPAGTAFAVVDCAAGTDVFSGVSVQAPDGGSSGDSVSYADFTALTAPGTYRVTVGEQTSYDFEIRENIYNGLLRDTLLFLYRQRCGMAVEGEGAHPICHAETAAIYGGTGELEVSGGWHDAGDYGRYTVPGAKAAADLMLAYELNSDAFDDALGIPESGNGVPDVLDEARYELEWLMKMQREDGGVYHKVTGLNFDGVVMPQNCTAKLYVMPVSMTATGDFAAVMYMASRIYKPFDGAFSAKCAAAAEKSLAYSEEHRADAGFTNPADVLTGEYPDENGQDEYFWAICEGLKTTGNPELAEKVLAFDRGLLSADGMGWIDMSGYAYYAAATSGDPEAAGVMQAALAAFAGEAKQVSGGETYGSSIGEDYPWGSNMTIANNGMLMLLADPADTGAAKTQLDYLLGVNPTSYCYVTGYGSLSPEHPHHRPSQSLGSALPGMLVGGPNSNLEDPYAAQVLKGVPKAACYVDNDQSYSCNEVAIYWNSPLVCLLAGIL